MQLESKIVSGLERLSETLKSLLWEQAQKFGLSPIQIQILLFVANHHVDLCNVSYLAKEFNLTKATISDAVKLLLLKKYLAKDDSLADKRRFNLSLTKNGSALVKKLSSYAQPISEELSTFGEKELVSVFDTISKLIYKLNKQGVIQVQRTCFNCRYYKGDKKSRHYCNLIESTLKKQEIRLDCPEFELR